MLDNETRRRIDSARDILVGKVPDPKSQVEQITIALIYKFMDDMDKEAVEFGGQTTFFTGEYEKYSWTKIFDARLGGHEMLNLYGEAIVKLNHNPNIPQLFRDIFKNAYLPYRDPETLKLFLKTINEFTYDHSERLGDAFEYLLSVLGSQGDAGQFRTPRHIIDFIVAVMQPKKGETIADPACGTAGFLISAYKYILQQNTKKSTGDTLTPDDRKKLMQHFTGYDISPDMVRLSLANMYLHGFTAPRIYEYDTLTSEDRWGEYFDVILANPPFMTPKGGIKPHKKFTMQANRSEVLFVDYITEHINPTTGRAGVIVPEGIIFQTATAYKALRKLLVDKHYLYAVVSLPAGVFQPYSGVKTSILLMDKTIARKTDNILFLKVEADGFDLGAQRRPVDKDDLPVALETLFKYKEAVLNAQAFSSEVKNVMVVAKEKIKGSVDYNLSIDRYRVTETQLSEWEFVRLGNVCEINPSKTELKEEDENLPVTFLPMTDLGEDEMFFQSKESKALKEVVKSYTYFKENDVLLAKITPCFENGKAGVARGLVNGIGFGSSEYYVLRSKGQVLPEMIYYFISSERFRSNGKNNMTGSAGQQRVAKSFVEDFLIPLPPLSIQQEIVSKIESYQRIIVGAKQVVENYKPQIDIDPEWRIVELGEIIDKLETGVSVNSENISINEGEIGVLKTSAVTYGIFKPQESKKILESEIKRAKCGPKKNSIIISRMNTESLVGASVYVEKDYDNLYLPDRLWQTVITRTDVSVQFIHLIISSPDYRKKISEICGGTSGSMKNISKEAFLSITVPLPPLDIQDQIVERIKREQQLVNANAELSKIYEQRVKDEINKLWQEKASGYEKVNDELAIIAES